MNEQHTGIPQSVHMTTDHLDSIARREQGYSTNTGICDVAVN